MSTWRVFVILLALLASSQASDKKTDWKCFPPCSFQDKRLSQY
ncbi:hypothetical protein NP493_147g04045 [Ridgeia piscesae]|uniref:Uncharacterized protein n=1 Tax=Ridgeia piscesae TaxID=27915 RepID=A0AAD9P4T5_RIDPI|nr:hypothetical protein NP493_147g04045 [Ridgeia piscesae]